MGTLFLTKEARIYNGAKTAYSINSAGSHQDSMVLAQRQKYRSMEQNRKHRDKSTHLWTPYL